MCFGGIGLRSVQDLEMDLLLHLLGILHQLQGVCRGDDVLWWGTVENGSFQNQVLQDFSRYQRREFSLEGHLEGRDLSKFSTFVW